MRASLASALSGRFLGERIVRDLLSILEEGLRAADPRALVRESVRLCGD